jgi:UDP-N-acetylmuramoylalanine--D-glutamate ligase
MSKQIAIFGAGQSGLAARRLADSLGHSPVLYDETGGGDAAAFTDADLSRFDSFVFSPGFAVEHPWRQMVARSGRACLSELAYAAAHWRGRLIAVTGTNGKTTVTRLLAEAFTAAGTPAVAAGNIGYPLADAVLSAANQAATHAVVEVSSFQAELSQTVKLDGLLWTNFAEDHLDRYPSMDAYFEAKAQLLPCLQAGAHCVVGPDVAHWLTEGGFLATVWQTMARDKALLEQLAPESAFRRFPNSENFHLVSNWWSQSGLPTEPLLRTADDFCPAAHRLSLVAERGGVRFWDDSKATNFHAARAALESMEGPIVWIGGGRSKGGDLAKFAQTVAARVDVAVLYGEVAEALADAMQGQAVRCRRHGQFADAVNAAAAIAAQMGGANVLLSPGFASFDQFDSYSDRGKTFRKLVLGLKRDPEAR